MAFLFEEADVISDFLLHHVRGRYPGTRSLALPHCQVFIPSFRLRSLIGLRYRRRVVGLPFWVVDRTL